ncbi:MAG TPA: glycosyltransferase family 25 protein [Devosia sp.]|nr:glycosyltransferase family 25 protein [Devosia sp.]
MKGAPEIVPAMTESTPIPCFVINLADARGRLAHMTRVLAAAGIPFERIEAVKAVDVVRHPGFERIPPLAVGRPWANAELACLLSHFEAWSRIVARAEPFAAVFEDDLHIDPRLHEVLAAPEELPATADIIKLETVNIPVWVARGAIQGPAGVRFARLRSNHYGGGAYVIGRSAAKRLLTMAGLFDLPMDDAVFSPGHPVGRQLRSYQVIPALAVQDVILPAARRSAGLGSTIEAEREIARSHETAPLQATVAPNRNRLLPLHTLPQRLVRAVWRNARCRLMRAPYADPAIRLSPDA